MSQSSTPPTGARRSGPARIDVPEISGSPSKIKPNRGPAALWEPPTEGRNAGDAGNPGTRRDFVTPAGPCQFLVTEEDAGPVATKAGTAATAPPAGKMAALAAAGSCNAGPIHELMVALEKSLRLAGISPRALGCGGNHPTHPEKEATTTAA